MTELRIYILRIIRSLLNSKLMVFINLTQALNPAIQYCTCNALINAQSCFIVSKADFRVESLKV